jgi:hypothetical protein
VLETFRMRFCHLHCCNSFARVAWTFPDAGLPRGAGGGI